MSRLDAAKLDDAVPVFAPSEFTLAEAFKKAFEDRPEESYHLALIGKWTKVYNLTAVRQPAEMLTHHLLDSLAVIGPVRRQTVGRPVRLLVTPPLQSISTRSLAFAAMRSGNQRMELSVFRSAH